MILTCPNCESRFLLPATRLTPGGRRVKCSNCEEVWTQMPDPEEAQGSGDERKEEKNFEVDFQEIPDSVKPIREALVLPKPPEAAKGSRGGLGGYVAAACVFVVILAGLVISKEKVAHAWPPAVLFYETIGLPLPVPGTGLSFDEVQARAIPGEGGTGEFIEIMGRIVNSSDEQKDLPPVETTLRDKDGKVLERWIIEMPEHTVAAQQAVVFSVSRKSEVQAEDIRLAMQFWKSKTVSEDAGNNPAPGPDGHTPQSASEEAAESPAPASAPPHPESSH